VACPKHEKMHAPGVYLSTSHALCLGMLPLLQKSACILIGGSIRPSRGRQKYLKEKRRVQSVFVVVTSDDGGVEKSFLTWTERVAAIMHSVGLPNERTIELRFYELCGAINVFDLIALSLRSQPSRGGTSSTPLLRP